MYMSHYQVVQQQGIYHRFNGATFSDISFGFMPAFMHLKEQQVHLSKTIDGELSVMHLFDGLPDHWIDEKDSRGKALSLKSEIIAGFMRNAQFYTLSEIIHDIRDS
ncbi:hypothetical protein MNBD_GAMMA09-1452 [hydrothermal vent metagenome]|uniref:Uncharacterized protein n=1 Tax=hydrothermal vent metagenome TaxID=652676 RepID=A0A3B0XUZ6_9ZZZZ